MEKICDLAPLGHAPGTYHERGDRVYKYLRDNCFNEIQKFNKSIRMIEVSNPSGVSEIQKINMAVAIHLQLTKKMDYQYKDFDKTKWRLFGAWVALRDLPKFKYDPNQYSGADVSLVENPDEKDALLGMLVIGESKDTSSSSSDSNQTEEKLTLKQKSRGNGRDKSKVSAEKARIMKRKFEVLDANLEINKTLVDKLSSIESILQKKAKVGILKTAAEAISDPTKKEEILQKIIDLTDSL